MLRFIYVACLVPVYIYFYFIFAAMHSHPDVSQESTISHCVPLTLFVRYFEMSHNHCCTLSQFTIRIYKIFDAAPRLFIPYTDHITGLTTE